MEERWTGNRDMVCFNLDLVACRHPMRDGCLSRTHSIGLGVTLGSASGLIFYCLSHDGFFSIIDQIIHGRFVIFSANPERVLGPAMSCTMDLLWRGGRFWTG